MVVNVRRSKWQLRQRELELHAAAVQAQRELGQHAEESMRKAVEALAQHEHYEARRLALDSQAALMASAMIGCRGLGL